MSTTRPLLVFLTSAILCFAADPAWKSKPVPDWTIEDAKQVLTDSPWAASVTPTLTKAVNRQRGRGLNAGGISIGLPGIGMGGGRGRGGYPGGQPPPPPQEDSPQADAPVLHLRWESALPIRDGELKAREVNAPDVDENSYAIAVYGVPTRYLSGDPKHLASQLKGLAAIRRDGQKDLKPTSVEILERDDGPVVIYSFSRKTEIRRADRRVEFSAEIGRLQFTHAFYTEDMTWQGKLEL
ncbi:MAG TPA: hypothetical protein VG456_25245 [Candidatus Sulfopaludibacter sp.]|jgi:hypothetical protein|nr:hypothetical protein [Candidatus Sulfopaludibacter sp.]